MLVILDISPLWHNWKLTDITAKYYIIYHLSFSFIVLCLQGPTYFNKKDGLFSNVSVTATMITRWNHHNSIYNPCLENGSFSSKRNRQVTGIQWHCENASNGYIQFSLTKNEFYTLFIRKICNKSIFPALDHGLG